MMRQPAVNIGVRAARSAAKVLLRFLTKLDTIPVTEKDHNDIVSEADRAAEQAIIREIRKIYPDHAILAEESGSDGDGPFRWVIDPLDGTRNFVQGVPHFAISLAMQNQGATEHAIIYDPLREELFTASKGGGAYLNDHRMRVGDRRNLDGALIATGFPFRSKHQVDAYLGMFRSVFDKASDIRRAGSAALDLAYVATGRIDGFWEIGLKPWDMAAGAMLIREAGGICSDFAGGDRYLDSGNIIAGNMKVTGALHQAIKPHLTDEMKV
jgi:myo-inositol-1(or 4)-monophosphatase